MRPIAVAFLAVVIVAGAFTAFYGVTSRSAPPERAGTDRPQVVLFVGDGMGLATVTAARIEKGTREGLPHPSAARLHIDEAPAAALVTTHSEDGLVTDSAASATAFLTGSKVPNGVVSWRRASDGAVDSLETVLELAIRQGLATGVVTTTRLTHATPACTFAHVPDRGWETEIAAALVPEGGNPRLGRGIDVILGGGFREFLPSGPTRPGTRTDGRDILAELERSGYQVVRTRSELAQAAAANSEKLFGAFAPSHMTYEIDRESTSPNEPSLLEMVQSAVGQLRNKPNGFFLLVEGGRIDHAHHDTNGRRAIEEMLEFDEAIGWTVDALGPDALVLVTADHDHSMVLAGYAPAESGVFSQAGTDVNGVPYSTILYANGPGGEVPTGLDESVLRNPDFRERAGVPLRSETHGGTDVPLYLFGPRAKERTSRATIDNTEIYGILRDEVLGGSPKS